MKSKTNSKHLTSWAKKDETAWMPQPIVAEAVSGADRLLGILSSEFSPVVVLIVFPV